MLLGVFLSIYYFYTKMKEKTKNELKEWKWVKTEKQAYLAQMSDIV